jgi:TrmH family RNA methyltransferase
MKGVIDLSAASSSELSHKPNPKSPNDALDGDYKRIRNRSPPLAYCMGFSLTKTACIATLFTVHALFQSEVTTSDMYAYKLLSSNAIRAVAAFKPSSNAGYGRIFPPKLSSSASSMSTTNWEQITNHKTSKTVKLFKSVHRANKSKRSELGLTVAEGVRLVSDILSNEKSRRLVRRIVISESLLSGSNEGAEGNPLDQHKKELQHWLRIINEESRQRESGVTVDRTDGGTCAHACSINVGTEEVLAECSGTVTSQGVVALIEIPPPYSSSLTSSTVAGNESSIIVSPQFFLILDGLSDPGNVGTLLRSCAASYTTALILLPGSCDVWNPKAVRSSMGASFRVPVLDISSTGEKGEPFDQVLSFLAHCGVANDRVFAATMDAGYNVSLAYHDIDFTRSGGGAAIVLGREGEGLRSEVRDAVKSGKISTVHVPMAPDTESLNAGVAGSVIMFERMRQLFSSGKEGKEQLE